jgi:hypothetical protein
MKDSDALSLYAKGVIKNLKPNLRKDIEIVLTIHPTDTIGGVVEVVLEPSNGKGHKRGVEIKSSKQTVNDILRAVPQNLIAGNTDGVTFQGTNISMDHNRIVFIKGDNEHWSGADAIADVQKVIDLKVRK